MAKNWQEVKADIEKELDLIWEDKPVEFKMAEAGWFPSGAGVDGSAIGNMFFLIADTSNIGRHVCEPAMWAAVTDDHVTLEQLQWWWKRLTGGTARILGMWVDEPGSHCPHPWLNFGKAYDFYNAILDAYPSMESKEDFANLYYSWANYLNCLNRWAMICFPWDLCWDQRPKTSTNPGISI